MPSCWYYYHTVGNTKISIDVLSYCVFCPYSNYVLGSGEVSVNYNCLYCVH